MTRRGAIRALFVDIGGVFLTNGWDGQSRRLTAEKFHLDPADFERRHHLTFDVYELGKITLDEYLDRAVFHEKRPFSRAAFKSFMFAQSKPFPEMLRLARGLKARYGLKVAAVSNEGRELNAHRIKRFGLDGFIDFFVSSCYVGLRKPDVDIYRLALDASRVPARQTAYLDDQAMFVGVARSLGIRAVHHTNFASTKKALAGLGLKTAAK